MRSWWTIARKDRDSWKKVVKGEEAVCRRTRRGNDEKKEEKKEEKKMIGKTLDRRKEKVKEEVVNWTEVLVYKCPTCPKQCVSRSGLTRHQKNHCPGFGTKRMPV
jgi:hypothetical protein